MTGKAPVKKLIAEYKRKKIDIKSRLKEFASLSSADDRRMFEELCFCLFTPQSRAVNCQKALELLKEKGFIHKGKPHDISPALKGLVRFHNKKAEYLIDARRIFRRDGKGIEIKSRLASGPNRMAREWLVANVKGLGYKEASHFLRNIGLGQGLAILDRHILKNLKNYGALSKIPQSLGSAKTYLALEDKAAAFARKIGIPLEELDLLLWSLETGFIFK